MWRSRLIALRWPEHLRDTIDNILRIPVDVVRNKAESHVNQPDASGTRIALPPVAGTSLQGVNELLPQTPRRRLGELVTAKDANGDPDPSGSFVSSGASVVNREQGRRLIAIKLSVRGRDNGLWRSLLWAVCL